MKSYNLREMVNGWFVGDFSPTVLKTTNFEVAVKNYKKGDVETLHHHKIATEITLIVSGKVRMLKKEWRDGDIIVLSPGEATDFEALEDSITVVVKQPSVKNDKYIGFNVRDAE